MLIGMTRNNKKYSVILFVSLAILSSCATILNGPVQKILITPGKNIKILSVEKVALVDSSLIGMNAQKAYYVVRGTQPLKVNIQVGSTKKLVFLKARNSLAFWANIDFNYGLGMLIDKENVKRFAYRKRNYLTATNDTSVTITRFAPIKQGTIKLSLSPSYLNGFSINKIDNQYNNSGVWGLETGLDYFYKDNHYLSLNLGAATDRFGEYLGIGYFETASTLYASVRNNNVIGSFDLGYGLNLSELNWTNQTMNAPIQIIQSVKSIGLGLSFSAQYRLGNYFRFGFLYQPVLFCPGFDYQHFTSFNLIWKFPIGQINR
ncbi:MAG TPA: hypothetical protein VMU83_14000 [Hanamia sp.]|nr:hypothetical protein [Hanamia sp.]